MIKLLVQNDSMFSKNLFHNKQVVNLTNCTKNFSGITKESASRFQTRRRTAWRYIHIEL